MAEPTNFPDAMRRLDNLRGMCARLGNLLEQEKGKTAALEVELMLEKQVSACIDANWVPLAPVPPQLVATIRAFIEEYHRAKAKHGEMTMDGTMTGNAAADTVLRLAALMEEVGEVATELTYDGAPEGVEGGQIGRLMKELIQVMNVAGTWHSYLVPGPVAQTAPAAPEPVEGELRPDREPPPHSDELGALWSDLPVGTILVAEFQLGATYQCPACTARSNPGQPGIDHMFGCPLRSVGS